MGDLGYRLDASLNESPKPPPILKSATHFLFRISIIVFIILAIAGLFCWSLAHASEYEIEPATRSLPIAPKLTPDTGSFPFAGYPVLERIAACESEGSPTAIPRQFHSDGSILWGNDPKTGKPIMRDVGILQINTWAHAEEIVAMHLDVISSETDNIKFGEYLYNKYGTQPWTASEGCWGK